MAYLNREHAPALDSGRKAIKVNYTLKQDLALCKKRAACDRLPYKVRENKTSTSVTLNTVAFEYFRGFIVGYLKSDCFKYKVEGPKPVIDKSGNVTADVIRVFGSDGFHLFTMQTETVENRLFVAKTNSVELSHRFDNDSQMSKVKWRLC